MELTDGKTELTDEKAELTDGKTELTDGEQSRADRPWLFKKGESGNPDGRPKDSISFKTKWLKFIDKIAAQNNMTPSDVDEKMLEVAYKQILSGDFKFWKDIIDRLYGTPINNVDVMSDGKALPQPILQLPNEVLSDISDKQDNIVKQED